MATPQSIDLSAKIGPYLDRHLVFPLLEFLQNKEIYPPDELLQAKLDLLSETNMVDFAMDIHKKLNNTEEVPSEFKERREKVVAQLRLLNTQVAPLSQLFMDPELVKDLRAQNLFKMQHLQDQYGISADAPDTLYSFAKWQFECGNYSGAAEYLMYYRALSSNSEKNFSALWGKLAAEILMQNWDTALDDLKRLRETIDNRTFTSAVSQLQQRTWIIHWSLFVFFNHPNGRNDIIDVLFEPRYLNAVQTNCPHILRYLATAVVTNKKRRGVMKDLVRVLQQEQYLYSDPITDFLLCLYSNFDFDNAQQKLRECETVLVNDFFLVACRDEFMENARLFVFETYCRIHKCIDIRMLAEKLNMDEEAAERWIVNLIRNARLDAKIDSESNHVIMGSSFPTVHQQVIEKTKGLLFRSYVLASNLERKFPRAGYPDAGGMRFEYEGMGSSGPAAALPVM